MPATAPPAITDRYRVRSTLMPTVSAARGARPRPGPAGPSGCGRRPTTGRSPGRTAGTRRWCCRRAPGRAAAGARARGCRRTGTRPAGSGGGTRSGPGPQVARQAQGEDVDDRAADDLVDPVADSTPRNAPSTMPAAMPARGPPALSAALAVRAATNAPVRSMPSMAMLTTPDRSHSRPASAQRQRGAAEQRAVEQADDAHRSPAAHTSRATVNSAHRCRTRGRSGSGPRLPPAGRRAPRSWPQHQVHPRDGDGGRARRSARCCRSARTWRPARTGCPGRSSRW